MQQYYYQISGKERYLPITKYVRAKNMADAKLSFLVHTNCDKLTCSMKVDKVTYDKHFTQQIIIS